MADETIAITGASRGIGAATARRLARKGRHLLLFARTETDLRRVQRECRRTGARVDYHPVDLSDRDEVEAVLDLVERDYAAIEALVLNAGVARGGEFLDGDPEGVDYEFEVNFVAPTLFLRRLLGPMIDRDAGRIVLVGSLSAVVPFPGNATYSASKAALYAFVRSLRLELSDANVHLGMVLPGFTRTSMTDHLIGVLPSHSPEAVARAIERCLTDRRALVVPGLLNNVTMRLFAALPELADTLVEWLPDLVPRPFESEPPSSPQPVGPTGQWSAPWPIAS